MHCYGSDKALMVYDLATRSETVLVLSVVTLSCFVGAPADLPELAIPDRLLRELKHMREN